jgi:cytochrome P450
MATAVQWRIPDHIRPDQVVDFDFYNDPRYHPDVHEGIARLVAESPPVFWTPHYGGHWVIAGHAAMFEVSRDTDNFSSASMAIPAPAKETKQLPISSDPPDHARYRAPLNRVFSPRAMLTLQDSIRALAVELIEKVRGQGYCDFRLEVAEPLPVLIFLKLMGLPQERLPEYRRWVREILGVNNADVHMRASQEVVAALSEIIVKRQARREDDLISVLLDTPIDGRPITFEEMQGFCLLLFLAGLDTVMNGMCYGVRHFAKDPLLQAELRADPARITDAVEEMLRRYTFTMPGRVMVRDHEAFGARFKAGERVLLLLAAADLDAQEFPDPLQFDLNRENKVHIAFNSGPHRCAGSHLARIELRILYEEWLKRIPEFRLDPARPATFHGGHVVGVDSLPLLWDIA